MQQQPTGKLVDLVEAACDGTFSAGQFARLEELLLSDRAARQFYLRYMAMDAELSLQAVTVDDVLARAIAMPYKTSEPWGLSPREALPQDKPGGSLGFPGFLGTSVRRTVSYFSQPGPLSILAAAIFMVCLISLLSILPAPTYEPSRFNHTCTTTTSGTGLRPVKGKLNFVARITGLHNCRWSPNYLPPLRYAHLGLGRELKLDAGLVKITYYNGAKLVLEGPVEFTIDEANACRLDVGKLAANVPKPAAGFTVETPSATIVDLGTEFGVEVKETGDAAVHVFQGTVEAEMIGPDGVTRKKLRLTQGQAARFDVGADSVARMDADRNSFIGASLLDPAEHYERWLTYSRQLRNDPSLVAYYAFEPRDGDDAVLGNQAATGAALDGIIHGADWVRGRFSGKYALAFGGPDSGDHVVLGEYAEDRFDFTGAFSVAVWFRMQRFTADYQALVTKGDTSWRLQRSIKDDVMTFDTNTKPRGTFRTTGRTEVTDGRWRLAVAVWEPAGKAARKRLYIDGRLDAENEAPLPLALNDEPVLLGGNSAKHQREFEGLVDEVAVFARAVSHDEIKRMYKAGNPNPFPNSGDALTTQKPE